jgi:hypothetical protein
MGLAEFEEVAVHGNTGYHYCPHVSTGFSIDGKDQLAERSGLV